jgi:predicted signal transduction protein with EAL and GGDEF domain
MEANRHGVKSCKSATPWRMSNAVKAAVASDQSGPPALLRSEEPALPHPGAVLEAAELAGRLYEVGQLVRSSVGHAIHDLPGNWLFFVNLHPNDLSDPSLYAADAPLSRHAKRVVLEITERASLETIADVSTRVAMLREMGFRIALDDLGAGYAGLTSFVRLEPDGHVPLATFDMASVVWIRNDRCAEILLRRRTIPRKEGLSGRLGFR